MSSSRLHFELSRGRGHGPKCYAHAEEPTIASEVRDRLWSLSAFCSWQVWHRVLGIGRRESVFWTKVERGKVPHFPQAGTLRDGGTHGPRALENWTVIPRVPLRNGRETEEAGRWRVGWRDGGMDGQWRAGRSREVQRAARAGIVMHSLSARLPAILCHSCLRRGEKTERLWIWRPTGCAQRRSFAGALQSRIEPWHEW